MSEFSKRWRLLAASYIQRKLNAGSTARIPRLMGTRALNREKLKLELAEEVLRSSGELRFVACGASMIPSIFPGDTLIVRRGSIASARCGEIVLWARNRRFCAHRVVKVGTSQGVESLMTRGDALDEVDLPIHHDEFLGRVHAIVRRGKRIELASSLRSATRALAFLAKRSDVAARCVLRFNSLLSWLAREQPVFAADPWRESMESE